MTEPTPETDVPADETPVVCDRCGRPFADETHLALHRGLDHEDTLSETERAAYETALEEEVAELRRFRLLALAGLVAIYFGFLMTYAVVT
ncbi:hypothetical protein [Haloplanus natans]|uniref:hypothetical protein n=1 Tax=Haloplanus natans TaxID=376171 RepID=UPI000677AB31|nr:hypothetical protein [Haloplanus natans]